MSDLKPHNLGTRNMHFYNGCERLLKLRILNANTNTSLVLDSVRECQLPELDVCVYMYVHIYIHIHRYTDVQGLYKCFGAL